ncbi:MAG: biopolymer transporter ExbD [Pseudomonadales bacterium]|nr:biopolymer transporter ExbD [Pseudomonadales bacterium]
MNAMLAKRRAREEGTRPASLNLVSLMDIFTILVFFLMVNSSDVEVLDTTSAIKLPDSLASERPEERIAIQVSADDVIVQGRKVASVADVMASKDLIIAGLSEELSYQAEKRRTRLAEPSAFEGAVTIMGDRELPYELLKRVMLTCQQASFTHIALAVNRIEDGATS